MSPQAIVPAWVVPTVRALTDCHWIAHAGMREAGPRSRSAEVFVVLDWVTGEQPTREQAEDMMMTSDGGAYDTVVWLLGHRPPPIDLPRRNPDGTLMTVEQLAAEYLKDKWDGPEERLAAENWAYREVGRSKRLAALVPE